MSRMKHLLRKLHLSSSSSSSSSASDHRLPPAPPVPPPAAQPPQAPAAVAQQQVVEVAQSNNFRFKEMSRFEEEYQVQLAMAISRTDPDGLEDPDSVQIKAAKQISLAVGGDGRGIESEMLSLRYWNYNVVNYDEKLMDGFYDLYGSTQNSKIQVQIPSLIDLQSLPISQSTDFEVISVNRSLDLTLQQLEQKAQEIISNCKLKNNKELDCTVIVRKIAGLVVGRMGGTVFDAEELQRRWNRKNLEMKLRLNCSVIPLGFIDLGLSRHRALLFKVLADKINLPCKLVRGSYYTGTDDGAVNFVKIDSNSEYMVDLMGAPGALIPAEVPTNYFQNTENTPQASSSTTPQEINNNMQLALCNVNQNNEYTNLNLMDTPVIPPIIRNPQNTPEPISPDPNEYTANLNLMDTPILQIPQNAPQSQPISPSDPTKVNQVNQTDKVKVNQVDQVNNSISKQEMQVNDVSKCLVTASLDPLFAGKLHAVLSENDASVPSSFFSDLTLNKKGPGRNIGKFEGVSENVAMEQKELKDLGQSENVASGSECNIVKNLGQSENVVIDEMEIPWEDLRVGERIGLGSYGEVYRADWHGTEVAVKKFLEQDLSGYALDQFRFEVKIMSRLRHPNIVLFMGAVTRPPNLSILTEFLPRGSLYRLLHRPNAPLDEKRRLKMAIDVARGMNYLHTSHPTVVHRDLKSPNLLVDKNWVVKVSDFGLSRLKHNTFLSSKSSGGTPEWMAPEVLRNEPSNEKCDVYSFGVILWELATTKMPWSGLNPMQVVGAVGFQDKRLEIPADVDPRVADIITACWDNDPSKRPSFAQLMSPLKKLERLTVS